MLMAKNIPSCYKLLFVVSFSLYLIPNQAAAASLTLIIPAENSKIKKELTIEIPHPLISRLPLPQKLLQPEFIERRDNLSSYLQSSFEEKHAWLTKDKKNYNALAKIFKDELEPSLLKTQSQDALWVEEKGRVINFKPDVWGRTYDLIKIIRDVNSNIAQSGVIHIEALETAPKVKLADINLNGISGPLGEGESNFAGSPKNRTTNIRVGSSRYQGVLIAAGSTFSFNDILGPVDGEHGFTPELVIKQNGKF